MQQFVPFYAIIRVISSCKTRHITRWFTLNHFTLYYQHHRHPQLTPKWPPPFSWLTTPLPLRGGAGGEALFAFHYFPFNYQQRHAHNCFISQLRWYCAIIPMDEFRNINVLTMQLGTSCAFDSPTLANGMSLRGVKCVCRINPVWV